MSTVLIGAVVAAAVIGVCAYLSRRSGRRPPREGEEPGEGTGVPVTPGGPRTRTGSDAKSFPDD